MPVTCGHPAALFDLDGPTVVSNLVGMWGWVAGWRICHKHIPLTSSDLQGILM